MYKNTKKLFPSVFERNDKEDSEILLQLCNFIPTLNEKDYATQYFKSQLIRYFYTLKVIRQTMPKDTVLDVGSYPSHIQTCLLDLGYDVDGVDIEPDRIPGSMAEARRRTIRWDIENERAPLDKRYDNALFLEVIEHLHVNPLNAINEISGLIKENGLMLLSTPNLLSLKNRINFLRGSYVLEHPFSVYGKVILHGSRGHQRLYSTEELTDILDTYGFKIINIWCIDNKSPFLSLKDFKRLLPHDFPFGFFRSFWRESISFKGKARRIMEIYLNNYFASYYDVIYILAQKNGSFCNEKFYQKIMKSDPWYRQANPSKLAAGQFIN